MALRESPCCQDVCPKASENLRMPSVLSYEQCTLLFRYAFVWTIKEQRHIHSLSLTGISRSVLGSWLLTCSCCLLLSLWRAREDTAVPDQNSWGYDLLCFILTFSPTWPFYCIWCHPKLTSNIISYFDSNWLHFTLFINLRSCKEWLEVLCSFSLKWMYLY